MSHNKHKMSKSNNCNIYLSNVGNEPICTGKTVKEITTYFENISKSNKNIRKVTKKYDLKYNSEPKIDYCNLNVNAKRNNMTLNFNKSITNGNIFQKLYLSRSVERDNVAWKKMYFKKIDYVNEKQNFLVVPSIKHVLKTSLTTCVGLLPHLI